MRTANYWTIRKIVWRHESLNSALMQAECCVCLKTYASAVLLNNHLRIVHRNNNMWNNSLQNYATYFASNYLTDERVKKWAAPYREGAVVNCNMGLERFHLLLKDDYLRFRQNKRIDELADLLIKYSTDSFRKDKHLLRGSTTGRYRLQISHANHKSAEKKLQEGGRVEKQANGSFTVFSSATSSGRNVTFFELCSCLEQNRCRLCRNYATYFASNYLTDERVKKWAAPYREGAVVNCNMGLERFHLLLKDDYLRFRQNKRIDELADLLIKYSTDSFRKDKHLLRGSTTGRAE
ncbi:hypothetical protein QR680_013317 [Steinernema hermaphroditum]|uniref:C2H2-type domain-containing protein n=1 Tax=Steinernema hermaphroditum TaxID=289476 RepID=A0AA39I544_9BILA|nr:hypothetical protein QR680_013317 [Steinernema hermaphroditum]